MSQATEKPKSRVVIIVIICMVMLMIVAGGALVLILPSLFEPSPLVRIDDRDLNIQVAQTDVPSDQWGFTMKNQLWGFKTRDDKILIKPQFDDTSLFRNHMTWVKKDGWWYLIDDKGKRVHNKSFSFYEISFFNDGLAIFKVGNLDDYKEGFIDTEGNIFIEPKYFYLTFYFEGYALGDKDKSMVFIDKTGKEVAEYLAADNFHKGLATVQTKDSGGKWGYINKKFEIVIEPQFDYVGDFDEGFAAVMVDELIGYIDKTGKIVIKPQFDMGSNFLGGYAAVRDIHGYYLIDPKGKRVTRWVQSNRTFFQGVDGYHAAMGISVVEGDPTQWWAIKQVGINVERKSESQAQPVPPKSPAPPAPKP